MFIACYCWADLQRATGCTHLMHKAILQNLLQGQVFAVCWQVSENVLWTKPGSEPLQGCVARCELRAVCSAAQPCHRDITSWLPGVWAAQHIPPHTTNPSRHTANTALSLETISNYRHPIMDAPPLTVTWNCPCLSSTLSSSSTWNITHPREGGLTT